ncbi:MAG TPA: 2Fe-2S iron-sulfur cluster-binding protein [Anaerovoracaceae bacterium]|nr:2Fe-2S iron-sulfur cluster-binding protein [Anaerovoracaceae bacterium]
MKIKINGLECGAEQGEFLLAIAERNNIPIPTLCHDEALAGQACCRICIVELLEGEKRRVVTACVFPVVKEIEVVTDSERLRSMRRAILTLLLARAPGSERIRKLAEEYGAGLYEGFRTDETEKCILCGLCVAACDKMGTGAISTVDRGIFKKVATPFEKPASACIGCAACANACPTGAVEVSETDGRRTIWNKEFELVRCAACGAICGTREQLEYADRKLDIRLGEYGSEALCEACRAVKAAERLRGGLVAYR